jgi:hypothetical protein
MSFVFDLPIFSFHFGCHFSRFKFTPLIFAEHNLFSSALGEAAQRKGTPGPRRA